MDELSENAEVDRPLHLAAGHARRSTAEEQINADQDAASERGKIPDSDRARYELAGEFVRPRDRVLELSRGSDAGLRFLRNYSPGLDFIGVDLDAEPMSALPKIEDHSIDLIVAFDLLERTTDPVALLLQIRRILIPGGRLILSTSSRIIDEGLATLLSVHFLPENLYLQNIDAARAEWVGAPIRQASWSSSSHETGQSWIATAIRDPLDDGRVIPYRETIFANLESAQHVSTQYARWYLNPWIVHSMVNVGYRVKSPALLAKLAARLLETSPPDSADYGAALCILAYRELEAPTDSQTRDSFDRRINAYVKVDSENPHVLRWRISLTFVLAQLQLKAGSLDAARQLFQMCAGIDPFRFSVHLATKTADAFFWWGWLAKIQDDIEGARRAWTEGIAFGDRLLKRPMTEILINPGYPNVFDHGDGMREFVLAMESITKCSNGLHLLGRLREGTAVDWRIVHMTFRERGDRLDLDLAKTRLELTTFRQELIDRTKELDAGRRDLIVRTAELDQARNELITRTGELDESRRDLIERTRQLEATSQELIGRTAELDQARSELVSRTEELDVARAHLIRRTADLERTAQELIGRTSDLDATRQELVNRTADLDATRRELIDRTNEVDAARLDLTDRTAELAAALKRGRFWRFRLVD